MTIFLQTAVDFIWGIPLLAFIFLANIIFAYYSRFRTLKGFVHGLKLLTEKKEGGKQAEGQLSHFQSFCNAIAATVGLGNISGVAIAIATGGPGALFWMWVAAIFGMNTKFFECTVAQLYRGHDYKGEVQGGAMYVIEKGLPRSFLPLAYMFAICGLIGTLALFQINQLALFAEASYGFTKMTTGFSFAVLTAVVLVGGLKRISSWCSVIVPVMSVFYFFAVSALLFNKMEVLPNVIESVFKHAFNPTSAFAGLASYSFIHVLVTGMKRATFSNEAGIGTAPMAHSNSKTSEPVSEGYVAMLGPFLDTIVICTLTALAILVTFPNGTPAGKSGIELTTQVFTHNFGSWGEDFLGITILLFAFSTILGMANYNQKCWDYLFKGRWGLKDKTYLIIYSGSIFIGALIPMTNVINLMDISFALMTLPNIVASIYLAGKVRYELDIYNQKKKI
jgi:AGCS family alanine or glycine:cation symporter